MSKNRPHSKIGLAIFLVVILIGCKDEVLVYYENKSVRSQPLLDYSSDYGYSPVWLTEGELFLPSGSVPNFQGGSIYNLKTNELEVLQPELDLSCFQGNFNNWSRLPNGKLGFIYGCLDEDLGFEAYYLVEWDSRTNQYETIARYPGESLKGGAEEFAITENFDMVIQEATGGGIMHQLYSVTLEEGKITLLFPEMYRSGSPSWSPDGERLIFAGNDSGTGIIDNIFAGYQNLRNEIYLPWDFFVMDKNGENLEKVLIDVQLVDTIKWSPVDEALIAFRGEYNDVLGLWVFNIEDNSLTFLWPEGERKKLRFDWSLDGTQLVVFDCKSGEDDKAPALCKPIIVMLPE